MIIYLHGFASHGEGNKAKMLRDFFPNEKVFAPTLPADPHEAVKFIESIYNSTNERVVIVGTSLGGFYAYYFAALYNTPVAIINPSLKPWETLKSRVGINKRYDTGEEFEWKEEYLDHLKDMSKAIHMRETNDYFLHLYIALDDEVVNNADLIDLFPPHIIKFYDKQGHRFKDFPVLLPEIKKILEDTYRKDQGTFSDSEKK